MRKSPLIIALGALALGGAFVFQEKSNDQAASENLALISLEKSNATEKLIDSTPDVKAQPKQPSVRAQELQQGKNIALGAARFYMMPDGSPVPTLPSSAPKKLKLSVVLFAYAGAQMVPPGFRTRTDALQLAEAALASASIDMKQAIAQGDPGSSSDIGWVRRNVLEKYLEYRVFNLKKGELLPQVIDTPRGLWIVKRTR